MTSEELHLTKVEFEILIQEQMVRNMELQTRRIERRMKFHEDEYARVWRELQEERVRLAYLRDTFMRRTV